MAENDIEFLIRFMSELKAHYQVAQELSQSDVSPSSVTSADEERSARIADAHGFDGTLFRNLYREERLSIIEKILKKRIETIPRIIAAIDKELDTKLFSKNELRILFYLCDQQSPQLQHEIEAGSGVSRRKIVDLLKELRQRNLVDRPLGDRGGEIITDVGRKSIKGIRPPAQ
jgi:hypothetical protein